MTQLMWQVGPFSSVVGPREDLKIGLAVQATDRLTSQRDDVVDLVSNSCLQGQAFSSPVELSNSLPVGPLRSGLDLYGFASGCVGRDAMAVVISPAFLDGDNSRLVFSSVGQLLVSAFPVFSQFLLSVGRSISEVVKTSLLFASDFVLALPRRVFGQSSLSVRPKVSAHLGLVALVIRSAGYPRAFLAFFFGHCVAWPMIPKGMHAV